MIIQYTLFMIFLLICFSHIQAATVLLNKLEYHHIIQDKILSKCAFLLSRCTVDNTFSLYIYVVLFLKCNLANVSILFIMQNV